MATVREFTHEEVAKHSSITDCWVIVDGRVCDVTEFLKEHPGGVAALSKPGRGGRDVTAHFNRIGHSDDAKQTMASLQVGVLNTAVTVEINADDDNEEYYEAIPAAEDDAQWHTSLNAIVETKLATAEAALAAGKTAAPLGPEFDAVKRPISVLYAGAPVYVKRSQAMVWGFLALSLAMLVKGGVVAGLSTLLVCMLVMFVAYDAYSGVLHIVLDCPDNISLPLLGQACLEFQWHHHIPTDIVRKPFIEVCGDLNVAACIMGTIHVMWSSQMGSLAVPLILSALKIGMAYFGQFSHRTAHDFQCTSAFAKGLQRAGMMISQADHKAHHKPPHDVDYCLVGVCNRPVDALRKAIPNDSVWLVIFVLWTALDIKLLSWAIEALMGTPPALTVTSVIEYFRLVV